MKEWLKGMYKDRFKRNLIITLVIIGIVMMFFSNGANEEQKDNGLQLHFFFHPQCPHCQAQKPFNEKLKQMYPNVNFVYHDVAEPEAATLLTSFATKYGLAQSGLGVPATFFGDFHFIGFDTAETTGKEIINALDYYVSGGKNASMLPVDEKIRDGQKIVNVPFFGEINVFDYSLPLLAIILGIVDGFNPCAMWVLVYLISLIATLNDRKKIWLLVGSFVGASWILYFLFMTAWLNVFLLIGYLRPLTIIIGLGALGFGILDMRTYFKTKGALACDVGDIDSKKKTASKIEQIVMSPLTWTTVIGIIALAFVVNSIEFVCSSALPAIYTHLLAISNLSALQYYAYIFLYTVFFMLDDMIIFSLAAFATTTSIGEKYAKQCKLIGGVILIGLGFVLVFMPQLLR